ncbi:MAG: hypothetical protein AAF533_16015 [Acidobacteriota bacterium]
MLVLIPLLLATPRPAAAAPVTGSAEGRPTWSELRFRARKALVAEAEVVVTWVEDRRSVGRLRGELDASFHGRSTTDCLHEIGTGRLLEMEYSRPRKRWRRWSVTDDTLVQRSRRPASRRERRRPRESWSDAREAEVDLPPDGTLVEGHLLLLLASRSEAERDDLVVVRRRAVQAVAIEDAGEVTESVDVRLRWPTGEQRLRGSRVLRCRRLRPADEDTSLGLFGLDSAVEVLVEPTLGLPVEVRGKSSALGKVRLRLREATLHEAPPTSPNGPGAEAAPGHGRVP